MNVWPPTYLGSSTGVNSIPANTSLGSAVTDVCFYYSGGYREINEPFHENFYTGPGAVNTFTYTLLTGSAGVSSIPSCPAIPTGTTVNTSTGGSTGGAGGGGGGSSGGTSTAAASSVFFCSLQYGNPAGAAAAASGGAGYAWTIATSGFLNLTAAFNPAVSSFTIASASSLLRVYSPAGAGSATTSPLQLSSTSAGTAVLQVYQQDLDPRTLTSTGLTFTLGHCCTTAGSERVRVLHHPGLGQWQQPVPRDWC